AGDRVYAHEVRPPRLELRAVLLLLGKSFEKIEQLQVPPRVAFDAHPVIESAEVQETMVPERPLIEQLDAIRSSDFDCILRTRVPRRRKPRPLILQCSFGVLHSFTI